MAQSPASGADRHSEALRRRAIARRLLERFSLTVQSAQYHWTGIDALAWLGSDGGRLGTLDPATTGLSLLRACLLAPIGEELLFRGALYGWLRGRAGASITVVVTAALFAGIHLLPILMPSALLLGLGLGWVRERTDSTLPGIVFHVFHNTAHFAVMYALTGW